MTVTIKVEGLKEIQDALHKLPRASAMGIMRRILKKRAKPIADAAISNVPHKSGALKASIGVSTKLSRRQRAKRGRIGDQVEVYVGAGTDPAAHLTEFGHSKAIAQPFLRPAWDQEKNNVLDSIRDDMEAEVKKTVARVTKRALRNLVKGR